MTSLLPTPEPPDPVEGALGHFEHTNWVKASLKALDQGVVHVVGGIVHGLTSLGDILVDNSSSEDANVSLQGNGNRALWGRTAAGVARWRLLLGDNTAEGGNDSGSLLRLSSYKDDGSRIDLLTADRNSGLMKIIGPPVTFDGIATKDYADKVVPVGTIVAFAGAANKIPVGWFPCDGTTSHGSQALLDLTGDTKTPDLKSRFIVGVGQGAGLSNYNLGDKSGYETVALTQAQTPVKSHTHPIDHNHAAVTSGPGTGHTHTINHDHGAVNTSTDTHSHTLSIREGTGTGDGYYLDTNPTDSGTQKTLAASKTSDDSHYHSVNLPAYSGSSGSEGAHTHSVDLPNYVGNSGAGADAAATGHENRPPYYALIYIIKG